jgi:glucose-6-phosphate dehydrogenase assembly protein OpcA
MTNGKSAPTLLGGQTQIDIRAIERELNELWKSAASGDGDQRGAVTRTCTLNLVAVVGGSRAEGAVTEAVDRLTGTHPNRAIVVTAEAEGPAAGEAPLDAWVQAHCQIPVPGRPQVCCEQITIVARGEGVARVPGTILPLLVPDLPVVVWYPEGEPFAHQLYGRLADLADRVIVDSETFSDPEAGLRELAGLAPAALVSDLAWGRLTLWRELVAQCFDSPAVVPQLGEIERVRVTVDQRSSRVPALLLAGWLAARLGWRVASAGGGELRLERPGGTVAIEVIHGEAPADVTHIASVDLVSPALRVAIAPAEGSETLVTRIEAQGRPALLRSSRWQRPGTADLLSVELRLLGHDQTFEDSLRAAVAML